jgi:hypothetical protein
VRNIDRQVIDAAFDLAERDLRFEDQRRGPRLSCR